MDQISTHPTASFNTGFLSAQLNKILFAFVMAEFILVFSS